MSVLIKCSNKQYSRLQVLAQGHYKIRKYFESVGT